MVEIALPTSAAERPRGLAPLDWALYGAVVFFWGTSWIALHLQLGRIAPAVSLTWRFALAALIMVGFCLAARVPLGYGLRQHRLFAALGASIFSLNFLFFYHGGLSTPSGLLAVVFSMAAAINMVLARLVYGERPRPRMIAAALLGTAGLAALFAPQVLKAGLDGRALVGLAFCICGTLCFCVGSLIVMRAVKATGVPVAASTTWGMIYGALLLGLIGLLQGARFEVDPTPVYLGSLVWLAVCASVLAFACYLTLLGRIGAERASYSTVLYPVVALAVSTVVEGYVWTPLAAAGLALVLAGNGLALLTPKT